jgi:transcription initiation factor TFIID subunit 1, fungi type
LSHLVCVPVRLSLEAERDERQVFKSHYPVKRPRSDCIRVKRRKLAHVEEVQVQTVPVTTNAVQQEDIGYTETELAFLADDWESRITYDPIQPEKIPIRKFLPYTNDELLDGEWLKSISALADVDSTSREPPAVLHGKILLNMNDQDILLETPVRRRPSETSPRRRGGMLTKFNVSNDAAYDAMRENLQSRIRSTSAQLNIEHSGLALRLQHPYFKTKLSKSDARAFHRPQFTVKVDHEIHFSKMRSRKKKNDRGKDIATILATSRDLSLSDNTTAVLMEFSEEYPPVMSNVGMASKLINFYRKHGPGDDTRPKLNIGEANVLDSVDKSPFGDYGHIDPGETTRVLYNKIIKAPIFPHEINTNDFILIRNHTRTGGPRYFLRRMHHLFVVGQTFPVIDVPSPHSRRALNPQKARLKMIVFRVLKKMKAEGKLEGLHVRRISRHFPDQNDLQIRGRLKEFMDFKKSGPNQGHWELKFNEAIPDEEGIRSMVSPETVALLDSMQAGARHLEDAGYSKTADDDDEESNLAIEQQLAPWIATRNFLDATQGKAMLKLNGEGDPTGAGEGFNFIKISMKGGFKPTNEPSTPAEPVEKGKEGRSYNVARQQKAYEDEITRIWTSQKASLSRVQVDVEEDRDYRESTADGLFDVKTPRAFDISAPSPAPSNTDTLERDDDYLSDDSNFSSLTGNRILRITRTTRGADGGIEKKTETVTDRHVISAYIKKRRQIEAAALGTEERLPTTEGERNARQKKLLLEELARLKRNRDRRMARQKQMGVSSSTPLAMGLPTPLGETSPSIGSPAATVSAKVKVATFVYPT